MARTVKGKTSASAPSETAMNLPFTPEQFFDVFRAFNQALWPAQMFLLALAPQSSPLAFSPFWSRHMTRTMDAMLVDSAGALHLARVPLPALGEHDVLLKVAACGVCRTDLHMIDGDLPAHGRPRIPGHEIVGRVVARGRCARRFAPGQRLGVPWLGSACGKCSFCLAGRENLCGTARFTGYDRDGGYAQYAAADERFCFVLPARYDDVHAAPLLCAGLIGYRAYTMAGADGPIGMYGFGAAAHIITQLAVHLGRTVYAFSRPGSSCWTCASL